MNTSTKRQRLAECILKKKIPIYVVYNTPTSKQGTHTDESKGWKKIFYTNKDQKKVEVAILISYKIDF